MANLFWKFLELALFLAAMAFVGKIVAYGVGEQWTWQWIFPTALALLAAAAFSYHDREWPFHNRQ